MLAVRLREHHQLDVGRIALEPAEALLEVRDLVVCQRQAKLDVGALERGAAGAEDVDPRKRLRRGAPEQLFGAPEIFEHALRHPIVQAECDGAELVSRNIAFELVRDAALDAAHRRKPAHAQDVRCLRRPGRDRTEPRHHQ
jgi:hypothetical protein